MASSSSLIQKYNLFRKDRIKKAGRKRAKAAGTWDFWEFLSDNERAKMVKFGNRAHKKKHVNGTVELTGYDKTGEGLGQDFKNDLSNRIDKMHGLRPNTLPPIAVVDQHVESTEIDKVEHGD